MSRAASYKLLAASLQLRNLTKDISVEILRICFLVVKALAGAKESLYFSVPIFMKTEALKSVTLKNNVKSTPYFSAYPLKAIRQNPSSAEQNNSIPKKIISRLRVMPMVNPYPEKIMGIKKLKQTDKDLPTDINWFNSYE